MPAGIGGAGRPNRSLREQTLASARFGRQICDVKTNRIYLIALLAAAAPGACQKSGSDQQVKELSERVAKLEDQSKKFAEVDEFVRPIMQQQKQQQARQAANEPDPNTVFAVPIAGDASNGPAGAAVTVVEAFDFA